MIEQKELPFTPKVPRKRRRPVSLRKKPEQDRLKRMAIRSKAVQRITVVVQLVATARGVDYAGFFSKAYGTYEEAHARVFAMALCSSLEIPIYTVARAFCRTWATVYAAERRCAKLYRESAAFRKEWDTLTHQAKP